MDELRKEKIREILESYDCMILERVGEDIVNALAEYVKEEIELYEELRYL